MNLSSYSSKSYTSLVLRDSEAAFFGEEQDSAFCLFLYCVLFIQSVAYSKKYVTKFS